MVAFSVGELAGSSANGAERRQMATVVIVVSIGRWCQGRTERRWASLPTWGNVRTCVMLLARKNGTELARVVE